MSATNTTGVPGLLFAATEGGVVLANAHGCGVLEDPLLASYWPDAVEGLTGHRLDLPTLEPGAELATVPAFRESRIGTAHVVIRLHAVAGPDGITVMAGGSLFGFLGMLLALPVAAVANVLLRYAHERYTHSRLYAGEHPQIVLDAFVGEPDALPRAPDGAPPPA